ncbi:adhesion G protein-coupled receptor F5-like [Sander lucioperca]|uniref:adhesion G protein-coupled receptor F5-like n=1 Tax=Sander lucioperca TaxID=283035 RepID=UPI00125D8F29|nr:adhesion G protein-coupled receptor F5-like [Sander lucioperca]
MALLKAVRYLVVLLVIYYSVEDHRYRKSLNLFFEELMGKKASDIHAIEKRQAPLSSIDYVLNVVINISDPALLEKILSELPLGINLINNTSVITSINITTVCSPNMSTYQCRCEANYAWSYNTCIALNACDAIIGNTCGCINSLPPDDQYCELNTSQTDPVDFDLILDLRVPVSSVPSNFIDIFRQRLTVLPLPLVTGSLNIIDITFTTECYPNSTGGLQCQCEKQFAWSCDKCNSYGACSNATSQTCECINGLPDGEYCEPITNVTQCLTPTPVTSTTPNTATPEMTTSNTTQATPTTPITTPNTTTPNTTLMATTTTSITTPNTTTPNTTLMATTTTSMITTANNTTHMATPSTPITTPNTTKPMATASTQEMTTPNTTAEVSSSFTMNLPFNDSYNDPKSSIYQDSIKAIITGTANYIPNIKEVKLKFRSGSTIGDYTIIASSVNETVIVPVNVGIFFELAKKYSMLYTSQELLRFDPPKVFFEGKVTIKCGPPPANLNLSSGVTAQWTLNGTEIPADDLHKLALQDVMATLTVLKAFSTDNGVYECTLKNNNIAFIQRGTFNVQPTPVIQMTPAVQRIRCANTVTLTCSVSPSPPYQVEFKGITPGPSITYTANTASCTEQTFTCQVTTSTQNFTKSITLSFVMGISLDYTCENYEFGVGNEGEQAVGSCPKDTVGIRTAVCLNNGTWKIQTDNCILQPLQELLQQSQNLNSNSLPAFLKILSNITTTFNEAVVTSPANINATVGILKNIANLSIPITETLMTDILLVVGVLTTDAAKRSWDSLNNNNAQNISGTSNSPPAKGVSSDLLQSLETITTSLTNESFNIETPSILLNKTILTDNFDANFAFLNSSVGVVIPDSNGGNRSIAVLSFASMDNVLPPRDINNSSVNVINGRVVLVYSNGSVNNVSFTFAVKNDTLGNPKCVFWNFSLFDNIGGWDNKGCVLVRNIDKTVTCNCTHLTSFSILMSPYSPKSLALDIITYVGVSISMASLVICLIIEAVIWKKIRRNNTSYLRHVSIVNIALSLLIADIWFIIGVAISDDDETNIPACNAATFFIHFFYLALFFWMLASGLLLLYRTVNVFDGGLSKTSMLAFGFTLGYGAPLVIVIITIAVTAPNKTYIQTGVCWLNWYQSKALLSFVIPALVIVGINLVIVLVVIFKMLRRRSVGDAVQSAERHVLVVIARTLAVLTPVFGLTWGLGVGTMTSPDDQGIQIAFAFFNSLQGFFILVFGTLLDKKVRSEITIKSQSSRTGTRSTSAGISSRLDFFRIWRRARDGYNVSYSASGGSDSTSNI